MAIIRPLRARSAEYFSRAVFQALALPGASNPELDQIRLAAKERLFDLHTQIYGRMRELRWDLYPASWRRSVVSAARVTPAAPAITELRLAYGKPETVRRLMAKRFAGLTDPLEHHAHLAVVLESAGLAVELEVPRQAWVDARNFSNKALGGPFEKQQLRQHWARAGGGGYLVTLEEVAGEPAALRAQAARLVNLGVLNAWLEQYRPGEYAFRVRMVLSAGSPELAAETLPGFVLDRLAELYPLYDYMAWSPKNNYCR